MWPGEPGSKDVNNKIKGLIGQPVIANWATGSMKDHVSKKQYDSFIFVADGKVSCFDKFENLMSTETPPILAYWTILFLGIVSNISKYKHL